MKKLISIIIIMLFCVNHLSAYAIYDLPATWEEEYVINFWIKKCEIIKATDRPTIFLPWITASWYSEEWYDETKVKRWIPDPITHSYDTLFYTFKQNGYSLKDVFYKDEFTTYIEWNPKQSLYLFWYDWKKDNKITAKLLSNLILQIREKYQQENGCDIWTVNIVSHSMWWLVARSMLEDMCADEKDYKAYYKDKKLKKWQLKDFESVSCDNYTRVNNFITIATPHRWSPTSFPLWQRWDISQTEVFVKSTILKWQLWIYT